jgi:hypothetical protein
MNPLGSRLSAGLVQSEEELSYKHGSVPLNLFFKFFHDTKI